jgi:hypothetical protein
MIIKENQEAPQEEAIGHPEINHRTSNYYSIYSYIPIPPNDKFCVILFFNIKILINFNL